MGDASVSKLYVVNLRFFLPFVFGNDSKLIGITLLFKVTIKYMRVFLNIVKGFFDS